MPPVLGPRVGSTEVASKNEYESPVACQFSPLRARLTGTVPNPVGRGHTTAVAVMEVAVVTASPNWQRGIGAGLGNIGKPDPEMVAAVEVLAVEADGPALGVSDEKVGAVK